jgi:hypothetical protein
MNESMESGNSSVSPLNASRRLQHPIVAAEPAQRTSTSPAPSPDSSWYEYPDVSGTHADAQISAGASGVTHEDEEEEEEEREEEEEEVEREEEASAKSETSSVMYDPEVDPEGFARRLDELSGTLEVGQEEARALRWGPAIGVKDDGESYPPVSMIQPDSLAPLLSIADFKTLVNHHLDNTDWKYEGSQDGPMVDARGFGGVTSHPIRVMGPTRVEANRLGEMEMGAR